MPIWAAACLRSWSATVELVSDVAADAAPFPLALAEPAGLYLWTGLGLNELNVEQSAPEFLWVFLLTRLPCVLRQWPGQNGFCLSADLLSSQTHQTCSWDLAVSP